jgi:hypothetical protein
MEIQRFRCTLKLWDLSYRYYVNIPGGGCHSGGGMPSRNLSGPDLFFYKNHEKTTMFLRYIKIMFRNSHSRCTLPASTPGNSWEGCANPGPFWPRMAFPGGKTDTVFQKTGMVFGKQTIFTAGE